MGASSSDVIWIPVLSCRLIQLVHKSIFGVKATVDLPIQNENLPEKSNLR